MGLHPLSRSLHRSSLVRCVARTSLVSAARLSNCCTAAVTTERIHTTTATASASATAAAATALWSCGPRAVPLAPPSVFGSQAGGPWSQMSALSETAERTVDMEDSLIFLLSRGMCSGSHRALSFRRRPSRSNPRRSRLLLLLRMHDHNSSSHSHSHVARAAWPAVRVQLRACSRCQCLHWTSLQSVRLCCGITRSDSLRLSGAIFSVGEFIGRCDTAALCRLGALSCITVRRCVCLCASVVDCARRSPPAPASDVRDAEWVSEHGFVLCGRIPFPPASNDDSEAAAVPSLWRASMCPRSTCCCHRPRRRCTTDRQT